MIKKFDSDFASANGGAKPHGSDRAAIGEDVARYRRLRVWLKQVPPAAPATTESMDSATGSAAARASGSTTASATRGATATAATLSEETDSKAPSRAAKDAPTRRQSAESKAADEDQDASEERQVSAEEPPSVEDRLTSTFVRSQYMSWRAAKNWPKSVQVRCGRCVSLADCFFG